MTEAEWAAATDPVSLLNAVQASSRRKYGLFVCACCRRLWHKLTDPRSRQAVEATEQFLDYGLSVEELLNAIGLGVLTIMSDKLPGGIGW